MTYVVGISQKANAGDEDNPPSEARSLDRREDQIAPFLPCLKTRKLHLRPLLPISHIILSCN